MKKRIIALFIIILIIASSVMGIMAYLESYDTLMTTVKNDTLQLTKEFEKTLTNYFSIYESSLNLLSKNESIESFNSNSLNEMLGDFKDYLELNPLINYVYLGMPNKDFHIEPYADMGDFDPTSRPWYQDAVAAEGDVIWTDPYIDDITGEFIISMAKAIEGRNGRLIGVLSADLMLTDISAMINEIQIGNSGYVTMLDRDNNILAHPNTELLGNPYPIESILTEISEKNEGLHDFTSVIDGKETEQFSAFTKIDKLGWTVIGILENSEIAEEAKVVAIQIIIITLVTLVFAILILLYFTNKFFKPIGKAKDMLNEMSKGHLSERLEVTTKDEIGEMAETMNDFMDHLQNNLVSTLDEISKGNLDSKIEITDEKDEISPALQKTRDSLKSLTDETDMLIKAAVDGKLKTRGDSSKFEGAYKDIIEGINETLNAVVDPLNVAAEYIERISNGDIPKKITDSYKGDFNTIKNNLNKCIDAVNTLVEDSNMLVEAAVQGKLDTRADSSKHSGDFAKIVKGINDTLDAVIGPVNEASEVLSQMQEGNLNAKVEGNYMGDHAKIKNALNDSLVTIKSYVEEIAEITEEMAKGNMDVVIDREYRGDFVKIKDSLNLIIDKLNENFAEIANASDQVSSGAGQISDGAQELSQGSTEQASSIEELTASITQIAAQTKQNASNADEANQVSENMKTNASRGNQSMNNMLQSMKDINESSQNIQNIIKVIDDIAFQTNLLALNAAVEAARAGQHGKGFAVVAEEVRNLAGRSADAAKETTTLIEGSIKDVEKGTQIAQETSKALEDIVKGIEKTSELVSQISSASNEQATGVAQINDGIQQVSEVVQNNSATAEEAAAASEELASQAEMLKEMVAQFKLRDSVYKAKASITNKKIKSLPKSTKDTDINIDLDDEDFGKY